MHFLRHVFERATTRRDEVVYPCNIFGQTISDADELNTILQNRFLLFTYRTGFSPLPHSDVTTDSGWGCLARSTQMLLAHALHRHCPADCQLRFFRDMDSAQDAPFALHSMVRATLNSNTLFRPEYWRPTQGCQAIRSCLNKAVRAKLLQRPLVAVVTSGGSIADSEVRMHLNERETVLLLSPIRCSVSRVITQTMFFALEHLLHSPSCVGVVGGVPNRSYYIIGSSSGQRLLYLDPHRHIQDALLATEVDDAGMVGVTAALLSSVRWDSMDSSFFMGFLIESVEQWERLKMRLEDLRRRSIDEPLCIIDDEPGDGRTGEVYDWPNEVERADG